jgi:hypothetical protein
LNKRHFIFPFLFILLLAAALFCDTSPTMYVVSAAGTPDEYGNHIYWFRVDQLIGEVWTEKALIYNTTYTAGTKVTMQENASTTVTISCKLNDTLATSTAEAEERTDITLTVAGATNFYLTSKVATGPTSDYYTITCTYYWVDGPQTGTTYVVTLEYQVEIVE